MWDANEFIYGFHRSKSVWARSQGTAAAQLSQKTPSLAQDTTGGHQIRGERSKERQKSKKLTRPGSNLLKFPAGICSGRGLLEMSSALLEWNECFWEGQRGGGSSRRDGSRTRPGPPATKGKQGRAGMGLESREFPTGNPPLPWMSHPKVMDTEAKRQHSIVPTRRGFKQEI